MPAPLILKALEIIIFILMLGLGVNQSLADLRALWRNPGLMLRSLLAVTVLFPLATGLLLKLMPSVPPGVAAGLAILAACPGAPVTYKRSAMAGGDPAYTSSLHITMAILTLLIAPATLALFNAVFQLELEVSAPLAEVARQVAAVQFLPIGLGLLLQQAAPRATQRLRQPLRRLADGAFLALAAMLLFPVVLWAIVQLVWPIGGWAIALMALLVVAGLGLGVLLARQQPPGMQSSLAVATIARNLGLALLIAQLGGAPERISPTILGYALVSLLLAAPFSIWSKRRSAPAAG
jgi:BASS family bile acid:Na+ symporter